MQACRARLRDAHLTINVFLLSRGVKLKCVWFIPPLCLTIHSEVNARHQESLSSPRSTFCLAYTNETIRMQSQGRHKSSVQRYTDFMKNEACPKSNDLTNSGTGPLPLHGLSNVYVSRGLCNPPFIGPKVR